MLFTPTHDLVPGIGTVAAHNNLSLGPAVESEGQSVVTPNAPAAGSTIEAEFAASDEMRC